MRPPRAIAVTDQVLVLGSSARPDHGRRLGVARPMAHGEVMMNSVMALVSEYVSLRLGPAPYARSTNVKRGDADEWLV